MQLNIEEIKQYICKVERLTTLIERSREKERIIGHLPYYTTFGTDAEMEKDLAFQKAVTARLANYLKLTIINQVVV